LQRTPAVHDAPLPGAGGATQTAAASTRERAESHSPSAADASSMRGHDPRVALRVVIALLVITMTAVSASRIVLSLFALDLGARASTVGLLVSTFFVFPVLLSWPLGRASDRVGSRWLIVLGTLIGSLGMVLPAFWPMLATLFAAAAATSFAFTTYAVLLQNLVGVLSTPEQRTRNFSNASAATASTMFTGPLIAGLVIDHAGHRPACLCVTALTVIALTTLLVWGRHLPAGSSASPARHTSIANVLRRGGVLRLLIAGSVVQFGQDIFQFYIPIYGHGVSLSASAIGAILAAAAVAYVVVRFLLPQLVHRLGEGPLLRYTLVIAATAFVAIASTGSTLLLGVAAFVFGLGMGCGQPLTMALLYNQAEAGRSGETFGLRQTTNNVVRIVAPSLLGVVAGMLGIQAVFLVAALVVATGAVLLGGRVDSGA